MVTEYRMSQALPNLSLHTKPGPGDVYTRVLESLRTHRVLLEEMSEHLLEHEVLEPEPLEGFLSCIEGNSQ